MKRLLYTTALLIIMIEACYYDNEENLYPVIGNDCDTTSVTYSKSVVPIIQNNCLSCHSNNSSNMHLQDYIDVNANKTILLASIKHSSGVSPMPKGASKLSSCIIRQVELWINSGAPNN